MAKVFIGLSGFSYKEWQGEGLFYPKGIKQADFLRTYASHYDTLEAVGMWQQIPSEATVARYAAECPPSFQLCPKMHRRVTHYTYLKPEGWETLRIFVENLIPLANKGMLGPILVQTPPNLKRDDALLEAFLANASHKNEVRWAFEFRNSSWQASEVEQILSAHNAAWVAEDTDEADAQRRDTADHIYVRLRRLAYTDEQLQEWAAYANEKAALGKDCYLFCRHKDVDAPWKWGDRLLELTN